MSVLLAIAGVLISVENILCLESSVNNGKKVPPCWSNVKLKSTFKKL
jgi:hypothetical protein